MIHNKLKLYFDDIVLYSFSLIIYSAISIFWANTYTMSIVGILKTSLLFILFLLLNSMFSQYGNKTIELLIKTIILAFLFSLFAVFTQILQLNEITYTSIFNLSGISGHKNLYSSFIFLTIIGSTLGLQCLRKQRIWHTLIVATIILQLASIILLRTRTVWIACFISFLTYGVLLILNQKKVYFKKVRLTSIILSILTTIFFVGILPIILEWYLNLSVQSNDISKVSDLGTFSERVMIWGKTFELVKDNLFFGVGVGNWKIMIAKYTLPEIYKVQDLNVIFQRPHNEFLRILSENGIIGLSLFTFLIIYFFLKLFNIKDKVDGKSTIIIISGFIGFLFIMFLSFPLERIEHGLIIIFLLSISYYYIKKNSENKESYISIPNKLLAIPMLCCLVFLSISQSKFKSSFHLKNMLYERNLGNNENVIALCDSAITRFTKTDDFSIPIYWYRGNANANMQHFKEALKDFKQAYNYHPYNTHVLNDLGSAYFMNNNLDSAICFYEKSSKINPRFDDPKLNLVAIYINKGDYKNALKWEELILHDSERRAKYKILINQIENGSVCPN